MSETIDFFSPSGFGLYSMTSAIEKFPNMYGRCEELNLFPAEPVTQRNIWFEEENNVLNLLPTQPVNAPPTLGTQGKRTIRAFVIPHIPHDDQVLPSDVVGVRSFGSESSAQTVNSVYAKKLQTMRRKHAITLEYHRMGALKGSVLDADGTTLYNYFTEFSVSQTSHNYALGTASTEVISKVLATKRHIEDNLKGEVMTGIHVFCSSGFYDALTTHDNVKEAFANFMTNQQLSGDYRTRFVYGGVVFEEYRGTATDIDGTARAFITADEAIAFPVGTQDTFRTYFAPSPRYVETVNTMGREIYAKGVLDPAGTKVDIMTDSNPLAICKRPELLVRLTIS